MLRGNADLTDYNNIFSSKLDHETIPDSNFTNSPDQSFRYENFNRNIDIQTDSSISRVQYGESERRKPVETDDIRDKI